MIIFVADAFVEHYKGGAEITTEGIVQGSLVPYRKAISQQVTSQLIEELKDHYWIFGNFAGLADDLLIQIAKKLNYSVLEYDYKFCKYRSIEKHTKAEGSCDCHLSAHGKATAIFLHQAKSTWWMSQKQRDIYHSIFPPLMNRKNEVLSSIFDDTSLDYIESLDMSNKNNKYIILNSPSWIKGLDDAIRYAEENDLEYELVWGLPHEEVLKKLAESRGIIFFPRGGDTCPRFVIEAKLLGCELILNDNIQHKDEEWFSGSIQKCTSYLRSRIDFFWKEVLSVDAANVLELPALTERLEEQTHFKIVVPFYNVGNYISKCIKSLQLQNYSNFSCILVNDISTDDCENLAQKRIQGDPRFKLVNNTQKKYALQNIVESIENSKPDGEDVIILLDGDDWLSSPNVLANLDSHYSNSDCCLTYGSYIMYPHGVRGVEPSEYPQEIVQKNLFRKDQWRASHLRTFKYKLWNHLDVKDLQDKDGVYYKMTYDQAIMLPLLEMAGNRSSYINDIMHVYNRQNPLSVDKIKAEEQYQLMLDIRSKKRYSRLKQI